MHKNYRTVAVLLIASPLLIFVGYLVLGTLFLSLLGFHPDAIGWQLAKKLAATDGDPSECKQIIHLLPHPFSPSASEQRRSCLYELAQLKKDPTICQRLLPSEYGLACLSSVGGKMIGEIPCMKFYGTDYVFCNEYYSEGKLKIEKPQIENCELYKRKDLREWCFSQTTYSYTNTYECKRISHPDVLDDCEGSYAFKKKDVSLCANIKDSKRREYCKANITAWLEYPQLRNSLYFGKQPASF